MTDAATAPRLAALQILTAVRKGDFADLALARAGAQLESRDYGWLQELVFGTLRLRGRIDHLLTAFVRGELGALDPEVLDVLRLGAYQLLEMGSVPEYAAVSQSVELIRAAGGGRAAGFVNGVLQSLRRGWQSVEFPDFATDPVGHLSTWGSHPRWLVERWVENWGAEEARLLVEANNLRPELYLRPVGLSAAESVQKLAEIGISADIPAMFPDSVRVRTSAELQNALVTVPAVVQDPAAAAVVRFANASSDSTVVDLCAAPGGKTVGLAETAVFVAACDLSAARMRRVRSNVESAGLTDRVALVVADARAAPFRSVDLVLLDAPCAGTGTLRRHPDGRWRITPGDLAALVSLQASLLDAAAQLVRPAGALIYSTCSVEPEENQRQVEDFLGKHPEFSHESSTAELDGTMLTDDCLTVLPQRHGVDGAFAARLVRKA